MECRESHAAVAFPSDGPGLVYNGGFRIERAFRRVRVPGCDANDMTNGAPTLRAVLIVECNVLLNWCMGNLVEAAGFVAIRANDADEAISILEGRTDVGLLVTNVVMAGSMNGVRLAHAVDNRWPSIKIIIVSGQAGLSESDLPPKALFFTKPYHDEEIVFEIRSLIGPNIETQAWRPNLPTAI